jgi:hypothetical protein
MDLSMDLAARAIVYFWPKQFQGWILSDSTREGRGS